MQLIMSHCEFGFVPNEAISMICVGIASGKNPRNDGRIKLILF